MLHFPRRVSINIGLQRDFSSITCVTTFCYMVIICVTKHRRCVLLIPSLGIPARVRCSNNSLYAGFRRSTVINYPRHPTKTTAVPGPIRQCPGGDDQQGMNLRKEEERISEQNSRNYSTQEYLYMDKEVPPTLVQSNLRSWRWSAGDKPPNRCRLPASFTCAR